MSPQAPQPTARLGDDWDNTTGYLRSPGDKAPDGAPDASRVGGEVAAGSALPDLGSPGPGIGATQGASDASGLPNAAEAPLIPTQPSSIPLLALAGLLLATGIGLAGLRIVARRLA